MSKQFETLERKNPEREIKTENLTLDEMSGQMDEGAGLTERFDSFIKKREIQTDVLLENGLEQAEDTNCNEASEVDRLSELMSETDEQADVQDCAIPGEGLDSPIGNYLEAHGYSEHEVRVLSQDPEWLRQNEELRKEIPSSDLTELKKDVPSIASVVDPGIFGELPELPKLPEMPHVDVDVGLELSADIQVGDFQRQMEHSSAHSLL